MYTLPFDGVVTKCVVQELAEILVGGRVEKVFQPEVDEIILNIRSQGQNLKLLLSANANYPRIHITDVSKENPQTPPVFCMLLRKHLSSGKITGVDFFDFERIIRVRIESTNELGDLSEKNLIIEIMGRHSNIILTNSENKIIDSVKHVDAEVSSVREVMPARPYIFPPAQTKTSPQQLDIEKFFESISAPAPISVEKYLLNNIKGFSPLLCAEICHRAKIDNKANILTLSEENISRLKIALAEVIETINNSAFSPCIIFDDLKPVDFHCIQIKQFTNISTIPSISKILDTYYRTKDNTERLKQKKADLVKVLNNNIDRCNKKLAIHQDKLREVSDREKLKLYGELITANIYCIPGNTSKVSLHNYYSENNEYIDIELDENITPQQNAQRYFKRYSKAKSAFAYTTEQLAENQSELEYLESVMQILDNCTSLQEIEEVREELTEQGYYSQRKKNKAKKRMAASQPLHYKSSDGIDIYVGKNNKQNDMLTLKTAASNDIWLHTKNIPGSHVIIKKLQHDIPDNTLLEAAILAAYHSKAKASSSVPVDYTQIRHVKKPSGAKPGMVIYDNYKTIVVTPNEELVNKLKG